MKQKSLQIIKQLQYPTGLFAASSNKQTGYNLAWIRDNIYTAMGLEAVQQYLDVKKTFHALLDVLLKHEYKIDWAIRQKPQHHYQYIHARYDPLTKEEIWDTWGNKQNDAIGALLFKIGQLEERGIEVIRDKNDLKILQKLVQYLQSIEYWHDPDSGMWEEHEEVHASSIGACVAGLKKIQSAVHVPNDLIKKGEAALHGLLPRESATKEVDMALLSLIYPYNVVTEKQRERILRNVEEKLVKAKGVIRYLGDQYYYKGGEAQWTKGFPWLATIYKELKNTEKHHHYLQKTKEALNEKGELPELYFADGQQHNENCPLAWSQAMVLVSL